MIEDSTQQPTQPIPGVDLLGSEKPETGIERQTINIENIEHLIMFQSGTATTAPTHSPRKFYEQIVWKDDGTDKRLWIWSPYDATWRYVAFT
jgi:hypothetical protein